MIEVAEKHEGPRELYPGECPKCGDCHHWEGEPDEYGNRFIEELGVCNNCAEVEA